jgi:hypothetical protein
LRHFVRYCRGHFSRLRVGRSPLALVESRLFRDHAVGASVYTGVDNLAGNIGVTLCEYARFRKQFQPRLPSLSPAKVTDNKHD